MQSYINRSATDALPKFLKHKPEKLITEYAASLSEKLQPLIAEISWTKHLAIIDRCKDDLEREFSTHMTRRMG